MAEASHTRTVRLTHAHCPLCITDYATCQQRCWREASLFVQMLSHRVKGLALMGMVCVVLLVVLTAVQAAKHDWFIFDGTRFSNLPLQQWFRCINQLSGC